MKRHLLIGQPESFGRTPRGVRGLKHADVFPGVAIKKVAPREGCVD